MRSTTHHDTTASAPGGDPRSGRIDVDAAEQLGLGLVEDGVVERLVSGDLRLVVQRGRRGPASWVIVAGGQPHASPYFSHSRSRDPITAG